MMKHLIAFTVVVFCIIGCNAQNTKKDQNTENQLAQKEEPKGSWEVKKEIDENGNIVKYDSIYTYSSKDKLGTSVIKKYSSIISDNFPEFEDDLLADDNDNELEGAEQSLERLLGKNDEVLQQFPEMKQMLKKMEAIQQQMMQRYRNRTTYSIVPKNDNTDKKKEDNS